MTDLIDIAIEPLTPEAFAPFGQVIGRRNEPPLFEGGNAKTWGVDFEIDGKMELHFADFTHEPALEFSVIERHFAVTQAFVPLNNDASVTVFAAPTDPDDPTAIPTAKDLRAFYIDGTQGMMMWKGTWHSSRFPAHPPSATFAFLTDTDTTSELTEMLAGKPGKLTQLVDYEKDHGKRFRLTDPQGLMGA
jgi:ureidoglycolate lyase